jgi:outer membrane protein assembly factor BamB
MKSALPLLCGWTLLTLASCGGDNGSTTDGVIDAGEGGLPDGGVDAGGLPVDGGDAGLDLGASVIQHHNHANRDGVFVDAKLTKAAVAGMHLDTSFTATLAGQTYAQPLFVDGALGGKDALIVATEQNVVYALDAANGSAIWQTQPLGAPVKLADLPCGNIDPLGVTGTPYLDLGARTIYVAAMTTPNGGSTKRHEIFALSLDTGAVRPGWPVDVEAKLGSAAPVAFSSSVQNQRGAAVVLDGVLYVPYGGHYGDCGNYHGWLVGVELNDPTKVTGWATPARGGGAWCASGVSTDGTSLFITTGNTFGVSSWGGGDAVIRLAKGPTFSDAATDYFAPSNWISLDNSDTDLGTHVLVQAAGVTPSSLVLGFGKDGNIYVTSHANMGGIGNELSTFHAASGEITGAVATYSTAAGTFVSFRVDGGNPLGCPSSGGGNMGTVKLVAGSPPTVTPAWCAPQGDLSLPAVSMTDASGTNAIVWNMGAEASGGKLYAYDAETGAAIFSGGGAGDAMSKRTRYFQTPIVAKGRVFVPADGALYAFSP